MNWDVRFGVATLGLGEWQDGIGKSPEWCKRTNPTEWLRGRGGCGECACVWLVVCDSDSDLV